MARNGYRDKVLPFIAENPVVNKLLNVPFLGTQFELRELGKILRDDEEIRYITACKLDGSRILVCVTNLMLYILDKGFILNRHQQSINISKVASVERSRNLVFGSVHISFMGDVSDYVLTGFWLKDTEAFQRAVQDAVSDFEMGRYYRGNSYNQGSSGINSEGYTSSFSEGDVALFNEFMEFKRMRSGMMGQSGSGYGSGMDGNQGYYRGTDIPVYSGDYYVDSYNHYGDLYRSGFIDESEFNREVESLQSKRSYEESLAKLEALYSSGSISKNVYDSRVKDLQDSYFN